VPSVVAVSIKYWSIMPAKSSTAAKRKTVKEAAPTRVQPSRTVKTKEYREAHHTSWGVHPHSHPKDPNMYYALCLSALVQLRSEKRNATLPRVVEIVKSKVVEGAFSIRSKVRAALQKMIASGRAQVTARGVISLKSKSKRSAAKPAVRKAKATKTQKTAPKRKAAAKAKKPVAATKKTAKTAKKAAVKKNGPAPAAKKARKTNNSGKYH